MRFLFIQTFIALTVLLYQASQNADYGYLVGWIGLIVTLLGGFYKLASQNTQQKNDIAHLEKTMEKESKKIDKICENQDKMADRIQSIEVKIAKL